MTARQRPRVGFRCDVAPHRGVGHLMRSIALAEELAGRGAGVVFCCDAGSVPFAADQLAARGIGYVPAVWTADEHLAWIAEHSLDVVVFDSYDLLPEVYRQVRRSGPGRTAAFVDGELRGAEADVLIDQNLGSEHDRPKLPTGALRLAGLDYVMIRDDVLSRRPATAPDGALTADPPKVLAFFGGTDPMGAGPLVARALAATGLAFEATVVAPGSLITQVTAVALAADQQVRAIPPTDRLADLVIDADVVIAASGTSTWELMCLGAVVGLVCVIDNQQIGYRRAVATGAAAGLGPVSELRDQAKALSQMLRAMVADSELRSSLARTGWLLVDGAGRRRVADMLVADLSAAGSLPGAGAR